MRGSSLRGWGAVLFAVLMAGSVAAPAAAGTVEFASGNGALPADSAERATDQVDGPADPSGGSHGPSGTVSDPAADPGGPPGDPGDPGTNDSRARGLDPGDLPDRAAAPLRNFDGSEAGPVRVVVVRKPGVEGALGDHVARLRGMGLPVERASGRWITARVVPGEVEGLRNLPWVERVRRPFPAVPTEVSEGVSVISADDVQDADITGEGVKVGVIDVTGFEEGNPEIAGNVAGSKYFSSQDRGTDHGTAVAEVVVDTAPDADLYLTNFDDRGSFENAKDWLLDKGVDVIVMSVAVYGQPNDGTGPYSEVVDDAAGTGVPWVNAAGNDARVHWEGGFADGDGDGVHNFTGGAELNYVEGGEKLDSDRRVRAFLTWDGWHGTDQDYDLYIVNGSGGVVAESTAVQDGDDRAFEYVNTVVDGGERYAVVVEKADATGDQSLELFVQGTRKLEYRRASGSLVAPATADRVTAVGAVDYRDLSLEGFSSHGPSNDGRRGVDLVAPDRVSTSTYGSFAGTSAAAPHVAGVVALLASVDGSLSPAEVEEVLTDTATDVRESGPDDASGYGVVDASAAVDRVTEEYPVVEPSVSVAGPGGVAPGESGAVTTELTVDGSAASTTLSLNFDPDFGAVEVASAGVDGPGSVSSTEATRSGVDVGVTDLEADSTVTLTVEVTVPQDPSGDHVVSTTVTVDGRSYDGPSVEVPVAEPTFTRPVDPGAGDVPDQREGTVLADFAGNADEVAVAVELAPGADADPGSYASRLRERGATVESVSERWIHVRVDPAAVEEYRGLDWVAGVSRPYVASPAVTADAGTLGGASATPWALGTENGTPWNVTGSGASVAVLYPATVNLSGTGLSDRVVASRSFGAVSGNASGPAVVGALSAATPDADLYVATFGDTAGYVNATRWIRDQDVDVVVMPANFYGGPGDGSGPVSGVAESAVDDGVLWVNPTGEAAGNHWRGEFADGDGDGVANLTPDAEFTFLNDGEVLTAGRAVEAWLTWDDWPATDRDYDLYLFDGSGDVVAQSVRAQTGDDAPRERISYTVTEGGYYALAVVAHDAPGNATLDLTVRRGGPLSVRTPSGSTLAPSTSPDVTAVGAVDASDGTVLPDSGRGPTADGRLGVALVDRGGLSGSEFGSVGGTGVAASRVAGVAALVASVNDSLTPSELSALLESTADDVGPSGPDEATGHGLVNATAAVDRAVPGEGVLGAAATRDAPSYLRPGESGEVTVRVSFARSLDRFVLTETFDPGFADATITDVSVVGEGAVADRSAGATGVEVTATGLSAGTTLAVTYRVTAPEEESGTVGVTAELARDGTATEGPTDAVVVRPQSEARTLSRTAVPPGGETTVTTTVPVDAAGDLTVQETVDGDATTTIQDVAVEGNGSLVATASLQGTLTVTVSGVDAGTNVTVTYTVAVPESLAEGDLVTVDGTAAVGDDDRSLGRTTLVVSGGLAAYANDEGVVDTQALNEVIGDWARGEVTTEFLGEAIRAWATGEPVD
ncbi:hypothetical protein BRD00_14510 [Halobacteriales archaeon QS_8_69_26]|nr:MAG: hypothetical protein BRD00_14510 [Halobacteriales archaeon QS_8_69_26]